MITAKSSFKYVFNGFNFTVFKPDNQPFNFLEKEDFDNKFVNLQNFFNDSNDDDKTYWRKFKQYNIYLYSAFYDNRISSGTWPTVRVIAVGQESIMASGSVFCRIRYSTFVETVLVQAVSVGFGIAHNGVWLKEYILVCQLTHFEIPKYVGIITNLEESVEFDLAIVLPFKPKIKQVSKLIFIYQMMSKHQVLLNSSFENL